MTVSITAPVPPAASAPAAAFRAAPRGAMAALAARLLRDPLTLACGLILLAIVLLAVLAPWLGLPDPNKLSIVRRLAAPGSAGHLLGTDELGRDLLSRLIHGARMSLFSGFFPVVLATLIGGTLGTLAGYAGGAWNMAIMRVVDVFYAFPSVLLAVAVSGALGAGLLNTLVSLTLVFIPPIARIAESTATQVRSQDYVEAARATGASSWNIIRGHVLANVGGPVLIYASSLISVSIVVASGLSFLGLGVSPPTAEWGLMLNTLRAAIYVAPVNAVIPGVMIFVTSMCFNLLSDGLRRAADRSA